MITKKEFTEYITEFQYFDKCIDRMGEAISGKYGCCGLWESDWYESVAKMLDMFLDSHFTEKGVDWVSYYLFESIDNKKVIIEIEDIFGTVKKEYPLNTIDELWDFLLTDTKLYFKNA